MIEKLCMPALLFLVFATTNVVIDTSKGNYNRAFVEVLITILVTFVLNVLCNQDLSVVSWIVVMIPFLLMCLVAVLLVYGFGMDPKTGQCLPPTTTPTTTTPTTTTTTTTTTPTTTTPTTTTTTEPTGATTAATSSSPASYPVTVETMRPHRPFYGSLGFSKNPRPSNS
jgi:hypothetical protein